MLIDVNRCWNMVLIDVNRFKRMLIDVYRHQWPFQEPNLEVPLMCFRPLQGNVPRKYSLMWYSTWILVSWNSRWKHIGWDKGRLWFMWFDWDLTKKILVIQWRHMMFCYDFSLAFQKSDSKFILAAWSWESNSYRTTLFHIEQWIELSL